MNGALCIILAAFVATASSVLADGTNKALFALAGTAIQKLQHEGKDGAEKAFQEFSEAWQIASKQKSYDKTLNVKAAECFLAFGQPTNAIALLKEVLQKTGRSLPPEVPYLLVKGLFQNGDNQSTVTTLEQQNRHIGNLPSGQRQELMVIGAKAATHMGDLERAKRFLKETVTIAPETQIGKDAKQEIERLERESPGGK